MALSLELKSVADYDDDDDDDGKPSMVEKKIFKALLSQQIISGFWQIWLIILYMQSLCLHDHWN